MSEPLVVFPGSPLQGVIGPGQAFSLPGDKSLSHRAALFAALANGVSRIENFLVSGVTEAMLRALTALGVPWELDKVTLTVQGHGLAGLRNPSTPIDCGSSATTLRLLTGALAAAGTAAVLTGSPGLCKRPMGRIVEPLQQMGAPIQSSPGGNAPLTLSARSMDQPLKALEWTLPVASAQVKSALLLAALAADGTSTLREPGPSRDHTERMLSAMGVAIESWIEPGPIFITRLHSDPLNVERSTFNLQPLDMRLPCDISSAAFLIVAALITPGSRVIIQGAGLNPTRTGLLDALRLMGADLTVQPGPAQGGEPSGDILVQSSNLHACEISGDLVVRMIDEFPAFAVAAAYASGTTVVRDAQELRYKESDRISALCGELRKLGARVEETADGFVMQGGLPLRGGSLDPHGDHRLAMSLAVAGLASQAPVEIQEAEIIHESFPEFTPILQYLGARLNYT